MNRAALKHRAAPAAISVQTRKKPPERLFRLSGGKSVGSGGVRGESGEAPPAAETASLFRGSGTIVGPTGPGIVLPRRCSTPLV